MLRQYAFLLIVFLQATCAPAQNYNTRHFSTADGLPATRIYNILQDSDGFLWFCTANGVARYDGKKFITWSNNNGFTDRGAFHAVMDSKKRVWFIPFNGKICYYANGSFHQPSFQHLLDTIEVKWLYERNDTFWMSTRSGCFLSVANNRVLFSKKLFDFPVISFSPCGQHFLYNLGKEVGWISANGKQVKPGIIKNDNNVSRNAHFLPLPDETIIVTHSGGISLLRTSDLHVIDSVPRNKLPFKGEFRCLRKKEDGTIWLYGPGGAFRLKHHSLTAFDLSLKSRNALSLAYDHESNIWLGSGSGADYLKNPGSIHCADEPDNKSVSAMFMNKAQEILFVNDNGTLYALDTNAKTKFIDKLTATDGLTDIWVRYSADSIITIYTSTTRCVLNGNKIQKHQIQNPAPFYSRNDTSWYYDPQLGFFHEYKGRKTIFYPFSKVDYSFQFFFADVNGVMWLCNKDKVFHIINNRLIDKASAHPAFAQASTGMALQHDGTVWIATRTKGVYGISGNKYIHFTTQNGLPSDNCNNVYIEHNNLWVATPSGACLIKLNKEKSIHQLTIINTSNGLLSDEVNCILTKGTKIYLGTAQGITILNKETFHPLLPAPLLNIYYACTAKDTLHPGGTNVLPAGSSDISISFSGISFASGNKILYLYKLSPIDAVWQTTSENSIRFNNLSPGTYTFSIHARNGTGVWSKEPATISFTITPFWWQTGWFYGLMAVCLISGIYLFFRYRMNEARQKATLQKQVVENELNALRAQMNPHFIFNSLNSIQDFILGHQPEEANYYLTRFASLMRMILDYSKKKYITLQQETDFLNLYMELEKLRFSNGLDKTIITDMPGDSGHLLIPPMLVQPLVENAIKYAQFNPAQIPAVKITISGDEHFITFAVEDNGPGREAVRIMQDENSTRRHESAGIKNVESRLAVLDSSGNASVIFEDVLTDGKISGTRATIKLPVAKQMEI